MTNSLAFILDLFIIRQPPFIKNLAGTIQSHKGYIKDVKVKAPYLLPNPLPKERGMEVGGWELTPNKSAFEITKANIGVPNLKPVKVPIILRFSYVISPQLLTEVSHH